MSDTELDQSRTYREYFELVQEFNSANDKFVVMLNKAKQNRQMAVEQAIKEYLNPLITKLQLVQVISIVVMLAILGGASIFLPYLVPGLFVGLNLLLGDSRQWGQGLLAVLGLVVVLGSLVAGGVISLVGIIWASTKLSKLNSDKRRAIENLPTPTFPSKVKYQS